MTNTGGRARILQVYPGRTPDNGSLGPDRRSPNFSRDIICPENRNVPTAFLTIRTREWQPCARSDDIPSPLRPFSPTQETLVPRQLDPSAAPTGLDPAAPSGGIRGSPAFRFLR